MMIATVTLNPAIDKTMIIPGFAPGKTNRARVERVDPGGKGVNVAKAARQLGFPVIALGFLAGTNGRAISESLSADGIATDFIRIAGETRTNLKIKDPDTGIETEINEPGFSVNAEHMRKLEWKIGDQAGRCRVVVFSGSLPPGAPQDTYARLIRIAADRGARTILDTGGTALRSGIGAGPDLAKPNRAEAEDLLGRDIEGEQQLAEAGRGLLAFGARAVVISLGSEGAAGATKEGAWRAHAPAVRAASSVGAGDAMVAALAGAMLEDMPFPQALRLAVAAGSATAAMHGTAVADFLHIGELLPAVIIEELRDIAGVGR